MKIDFNINNIVRPTVTALKPYSSARDEYQSTGNSMIFLDANENPFPSNVNRYPDPQQRQLKSRIGELKGINPDNILLGNGSDEVLDLIFRAFCEPGRSNVITLPPTYGMYGVLANINDIENREVLLSQKFEPQIEEIFKAVSEHSRIIFLCSPNNPTGNSFSEEIVIEILNRFNGLVVIDEAYIDFSEKDSWLKNLITYPNLVITQTLSKAYGLAGIRLGICYATKEIITILNKIKPPYNINELTQERALERLKSVEVVNSEIADILLQRDRLFKALHEVYFVSKVYRSDANFILIEVDDANSRYSQLLEKGIVIRNRSSQPLCSNTLRITVGTASENSKLLDAFRDIS